MRKAILAITAIVFAALVLLLLFGIVNKIDKIRHISERIKTLPSFSFFTLNNEPFNSSDISEGPLLVVLFHPECEHCHYEISELMESSLSLSGSTILLVSSAARDSIRKFINQFDNIQATNLIPLADTSYQFGDIFGSSVVPSNYIYDKELKLVKVLYGEVKTETILKYMLRDEDDRQN
jgi:hypothetical protein